MSRYVVWDKKTPVITPSGDVFSPEQWSDKYPMTKIDGIDVVLSGDSVLNGAICNEYTSFVKIYKDQGCDFEGCETRQDHLDRIEEFEDTRNANPEPYTSPEERQAAALETQAAIMEAQYMDSMSE